MIKKITILFVLSLLVFTGKAQTFSHNYRDGKIYLRVKSNSSIQLGKQMGWKNLDPSKFPMLKNISSVYGITNVSKPFFAAKDDDVLQRTYIVHFSDYAAVDALVKALEVDPSVELAEKVPYMRTSLVPNDPNYFSGSNNTKNWHLIKIGAGAAWDVFSTGSTIPVAVVDNAMQTNHPDLAANMYVNAGEIAGNGIDDDNNGFVDDVTGYDIADDDSNPNPPNTTMDHGTHCSGLVSACSNNGVGIASIGYSVKIIPVKCTGDASDPTGIDAGYPGIVYAVIAGARVISCSWGGGSWAQTEQSVINYAWAHNAIVVAAAGNDNTSTPGYPGAYDNVYCVASTTTSDTRSSFSNYGSWVDIASPGSGIYSTLPGSSYGSMSGTSMATPIVAGLAGLMISKNPYLTPTQILNCISSTAVNVGSNMGAGRINAAAAMNCVASAVAPAPTVNFMANKTLVCPGTPIQFTDLTFYNPTSWTWTFTGGSPSTSTAQNPTVTYAAAGTYSVQLTAGNANGSNTVTKTAYINVTGPTTLPLIEGFTGTVFPPAGWADDDLFNDSIKWYRNTNAGGFGTSSESMYFDNYSSDVHGKPDGVLTPKYDFSALSSATLKFDVAYARYDATYSDSLAVAVSTDCGQTYTQVYLKGGPTLATATDYTVDVFQPTSTQWRTETVDLSSFDGQGSVLVAFQNIGHYGQAIYVDNINISGVVSGVAPTAYFSNSANSCTGQTIVLGDQSTNNPTSWSWSTTGGTLSSTTDQNPTITFSTSGTYTVTLTASNSYGSSAPVSHTFAINQTPVAAASNDGPYCVQGTITLSGSGTGSYTWTGPASFNSTLQSPVRNNISHSMGGTYTLVVTANGCSDTSTTDVVVNYAPNAALSGPSAFCQGDSVVLSAASSSGGTGLTVTGYQWQESGNAIAGATSVTYTASQAGVYSVVITNSGGCTKVSGNKTITVNALPVVVALASPSDTICSGDQMTLSGSGASTYSWNNGVSDGAAFTPSATGTYVVSGTDANNCTNVDSIEVVVNSCVGIKEFAGANNMLVYPNPNNGSFEIQLPGYSSTALNYSIINALGQTIYSNTVKTKAKVSLDVEEGIYFVRLTDETGYVITKKLIVSK